MNNHTASRHRAARLWTRPLTVYVAVAAALTTVTLIAYHAHSVWHVGWAMFAACGVFVVVAISMRDATVPFLSIVVAAPLELAVVASRGATDVRLFHVALACGMITAGYMALRSGGVLFARVRRRWTIADTAVGALAGVNLLTLPWAEGIAMAGTQTVILVICVSLYAVTRFFVATGEDASRAMAVLVGAAVPTGLYAVAQNVLFHNGWPSGAIMPGRPNALLSEPDWLGVYAVIVYGAILTQLFAQSRRTHTRRVTRVVLFAALTLTVVVVVITAARSAWVGAAAVTLLYGLALMARGLWDTLARHVAVGVLAGACAAGIVVCGQLTRFSLFDRVSSTGTGQQEITVSCADAAQAQQLAHQRAIGDMSELARYGCRHIMLEEVAREDAAGNSVIRVKRADPTIAVRREIYATVVRAIGERPWTGYGWGAATQLLGFDERGVPLNTSNIFLEIALAVGVGGAVIYGIALVAVWVSGVWHWMRRDTPATAALAAIVGVCAITVPNLFNAGVFLAITWVVLGIIAVSGQRRVSDTTDDVRRREV